MKLLISELGVTGLVIQVGKQCVEQRLVANSASRTKAFKVIEALHRPRVKAVVIEG